MKKSIKYLFLLGLLVNPLSVHALTGGIELTCDKAKLSSGESTTCTLTGTASNGSVSNLSGQISVSNNLELVSVTTDNIWQGSGDGGNIQLYTDVDKTGKFNIATFVVRTKNVTNSNENITVNNIKFYDENYSEISIENVSKSIRIPSTVNTLNSLTVSGANLSFNKETTTYNVTVNNDKTNINAVKTDENSTLTGSTGEQSLKYGNNTFKITVTSEVGTTKTYTINVNRPDNRSKNNNLSVLKVKDYDIKFNKEKLEYRIVVPYSLEKLYFWFEEEDLKSKVEELFSEGIAYDEEAMDELDKKIEAGKLKEEDYYLIVKGLKVGENKITIKVTAENETTKEYSLTILRENEKGEVPAQKVDVPDTNQTVPPLVIALGIILVITGIGVVIYIIKRKEVKEWLENKKNKGNKDNE